MSRILFFSRSHLFQPSNALGLARILIFAGTKASIYYSAEHWLALICIFRKIVD